MANPREMIEQAARDEQWDMPARFPVEGLPFVREYEAQASIAISLKRIADRLESFRG